VRRRAPPGREVGLGPGGAEQDKAQQHRHHVRPGDNADDGATEIQKFVEVFTAGTLDPRSLYAQRSNEELAAIPELGNLMRLRCISL